LPASPGVTLPAAEAETPGGVTPGWKVGAFCRLSRVGGAPAALPPLAGDVSAATDEVGTGVTDTSGVIDGAAIAPRVVVGGVAFPAARALIEGDVIGAVVCFSNCRATPLSFPRSRGGDGTPGVVVLTGGALTSGSPTAARFDGEITGGAVGVGREDSVDFEGDVLVEDGVAIGVAIARGVNARCGIGLDVSAALGVEVGVAVAIPRELVSVARTNFFGGASRGGVASALILARACSASCWLVIAAQPKSTVA